MRSRALLHKTKLEDFRNWLVDQGALFFEPKEFEVLRGTINGELFIVHYRFNGDHYTAWGKSLSLVKRYLRERRKE